MMNFEEALDFLARIDPLWPILGAIAAGLVALFRHRSLKLAQNRMETSEFSAWSHKMQMAVAQIYWRAVHDYELGEAMVDLNSTIDEGRMFFGKRAVRKKDGLDSRPVILNQFVELSKLIQAGDRDSIIDAAWELRMSWPEQMFEQLDRSKYQGAYKNFQKMKGGR